MFPLSAVVGWSDWKQAFVSWAMKLDDFQERFRRANEFYERIVKNFTEYIVPVIELTAATSKEAVCVVFEKVNTRGTPLDAFELITAMYAADGYELRKDWYGGDGVEGRHERFRSALKLPSAAEGVLAGVGNTDFLQAISLFYTRDVRSRALSEGKSGKELP